MENKKLENDVSKMWKRYDMGGIEFFSYSEKPSFAEKSFQI